MRVLKVALATCARVPDLADDDRLLLHELTRRGVDARPAVWDNPRVTWPVFDRVVIRSCWDYHRRLPQFLAWLDRLEHLAVSVWNPVPLVRVNAHKSYLRELEAAGLPVVPTAWLARGSDCDLRSLLHERGWDRAVIKPAVSASAFRTWRVSAPDTTTDVARRTFRKLLAESDVLVQRFLPEIERYGEWSFVFLGGAFSHAVLKRPAAGDFRVQAEFGGSFLEQTPPRPAVAQALAIAHHIPRPWAYARVDAVLTERGLTLMELELIEPQLFLACHPTAAARFADAILSDHADS
jgi:glutathione synthase/RimK-type ligase-like ATP-grasp enzyme